MAMNKFGIDIAVPTAILCAAMSCVGAGVTVRNASFEDFNGGNVAEWSLPDETFHVERGAGHNGSSGLVWGSPVPIKRNQAVRQQVFLEKGRAYRFSTLVETRVFVSGGFGACICLEWYDAAGKYIGGEYVHHGIRERNAAWSMLEGSTDKLPDKAARAYLQLYVGEGSSGRVAFDEVVLSPRDPPPVAYVVSSRYRDQGCDGKVRFSAAIYPPHGVSLEGVSAIFTYTGTTGDVREVKVSRMDSGVVFMDVEVLGMAFGVHPVTCTLSDTNGNVLGTASCMFERVRHTPRRKVWIDEHKRCIVDGRPFFPLGMYSGTLEQGWLKEYAKGPFNCIAPYGRTDVERLDWCHELGLKCFATLKDELPGTARARSLGLTTAAAADEYLVKEIRKVLDHPALLAWYVTDEPSAVQADMLVHRQGIFRKYDGNHPTWGVFCRLHDLREFVPACDVLGVDPYPVPKLPLSHVTDFVHGARQELPVDRPMWNVPQMFAWKWFRKEVSGDERFPTETEMRSMVWQHIAGGAQGLIGFSYQSILNKASAEEFHGYWSSICRVCGEVARLSPILLSAEVAPTVSCSNKDVVVRTWVHAGELYLLACNIAAHGRKAELQVPGEGRRILSHEIGASARLGGRNSLQLNLPSLGVELVRLSSDSATDTTARLRRRRRSTSP